MTVIVPVALTGIVVVAIFAFMNMRAGSGGTNAKMMNFGKSRARMSRDNKVNFSKVAGLEEEKEELEEVVDVYKRQVFALLYRGTGGSIRAYIIAAAAAGMIFWDRLVSRKVLGVLQKFRKYLKMKFKKRKKLVSK